MTSEFIAKPGRMEVGQKYAGAASGTIDPGEIAESILGDINWGELMGYCWRRFGPPNKGSDPYKGLAEWYITTPMDGLFLVIMPRPHGTNLLFGYVMTRELDGRLGDEQCRRRQEGSRRWEEWLFKNKGERPISWEDEGYGTPEYNSRQDTIQRYWLEYKTTEDAQVPLETPTPLNDAARQAVKTTILDLKRPVFVRDVPINVYGAIDDDDLDVYQEAADPFHASGYPIPHELLEDPEAWLSLTRSVFSFGRSASGVRAAASVLACSNSDRKIDQ